MKKFLQQITFARFLIVACLVGSVVLGGMAWNRRKANEELRGALATGGEFERLTRETQENSRLFTQLMKEHESQDLGAQSNPDSYIRRHAYDDTARLGDVDILPNERSYGKYVDKTYKITPKDKDQAYSRTAIGNFLYNLEANSSRVRVTELEIRTQTPKGRRLNPEDVPEDKWTFTATVASRTRTDS
jgi:hypothetical protein